MKKSDWKKVRFLTVILVLSLLAMPWAIDMANAEDYVIHTSVNASPFVCRLDGVEQTGGHSTTHKANERASNLKLSNPESTVICERLETIVTALTAAGLALVTPSVPLPPDPDPDPEVTPGSVTLSWIAPTENENGSPLTNLAGYKIHRGIESGIYLIITDVDDSSALSYVIDGLRSTDYFFAMKSINSFGDESVFSSEIMKKVP